MVKFRVEGMTCGGCARSVSAAVRGADPGAAVEVDLPSKTVSIESSTAPEQFQRAIEQAGYHARPAH